MGMMVGARELKTRLGAYLGQVRRGVTIVVTERGSPVAELRPLGRGARGVAARLDELVALGVLSRPSKKALAPFRPIRATGRPLSEAIIEDRTERV